MEWKIYIFYLLLCYNVTIQSYINGISRLNLSLPILANITNNKKLYFMRGDHINYTCISEDKPKEDIIIKWTEAEAGNLSMPISVKKGEPKMEVTLNYTINNNVTVECVSYYQTAVNYIKETKISFKILMANRQAPKKDMYFRSGDTIHYFCVGTPYATLTWYKENEGSIHIMPEELTKYANGQLNLTTVIEANFNNTNIFCVSKLGDSWLQTKKYSIKINDKIIDKIRKHSRTLTENAIQAQYLMDPSAIKEIRTQFDQHSNLQLEGKPQNNRTQSENLVLLRGRSYYIIIASTVGVLITITLVVIGIIYCCKRRREDPIYDDIEDHYAKLQLSSESGEMYGSRDQLPSYSKVIGVMKLKKTDVRNMAGASSNPAY